MAVRSIRNEVEVEVGNTKPPPEGLEQNERERGTKAKGNAEGGTDDQVSALSSQGMSWPTGDPAVEKGTRPRETIMHPSRIRLARALVTAPVGR